MCIGKPRRGKNGESNCNNGVEVGNDDDSDDDDSSDSDIPVIDLTAWQQNVQRNRYRGTKMMLTVKATKPFQDCDNNPSVFVMLQWSHWGMKSNAINDCISTYFDTYEDEAHEIFDRAWSVKEREMAYSVNSSEKLIATKKTGEQYPCYLSVIKLYCFNSTPMATVKKFMKSLRKFIKCASFKDCYLYCLEENYPGSNLPNVLRPESNSLWAFCNNYQVESTYNETLDVLVVDEDIVKLFKEAVGVDVSVGRNLMMSDDARSVLFKKPSAKTF